MGDGWADTGPCGQWAGTAGPAGALRAGKHSDNQGQPHLYTLGYGWNRGELTIKGRFLCGIGMETVKDEGEKDMHEENS